MGLRVSAGLPGNFFIGQLYEMEISGTFTVTAADEIRLTGDDGEVWTFRFERDGGRLNLGVFNFIRN